MASMFGSGARCEVMRSIAAGHRTPRWSASCFVKRRGGSEEMRTGHSFREDVVVLYIRTQKPSSMLIDNQDLPLSRCNTRDGVQESWGCRYG